MADVDLWRLFGVQSDVTCAMREITAEWMNHDWRRYELRFTQGVEFIRSEVFDSRQELDARSAGAADREGCGGRAQ